MTNLDNIHAIDERNEETADCGSSSYETKQWEKGKAVCDSRDYTTNSL